jgi:hypothetical protein
MYNDLAGRVYTKQVGSGFGAQDWKELGQFCPLVLPLPLKMRALAKKQFTGRFMSERDFPIATGRDRYFHLSALELTLSLTRLYAGVRLKQGTRIVRIPLAGVGTIW